MIKKILLFSFISLILVSCNNDNDFVLNGKVNGLKKGTLYLQRIEDTTLVNLDSVVVDGDSEFTLEAKIKEPQIVYLNLEKIDDSDYDDRIIIFAEPGEMTLTTSLKNFESQAAITGSRNQLKLDEYKKMAMRFNSANLDLIKKSFDARKNEMEDSIIAYDKQLQNLTRRKYLYTVNYAMNNKDLEIAPYLAVSEIFDANVKYLDTIYSSLTPQVRKSKYGKTLKEFIEERKNTDQQTPIQSSEVIEEEKE
ncbi:DUF4369 domain-containing protein [Leeuwenhoekiella sp. A16]|uniref:DUF4369 domain-containing protein n=1 Tax=unclassified Leeuwenhoekiella TaxID=2615029 RepID=UPI003A80EC5F